MPPPLPDPRPSQASHSPTSQVRGCGRNCVGIQGPCLFRFSFLGQRGQNLQGRWGGERAEDAPVTRARAVQLRPQRPLTISPEAWWSAPRRQSGTTQWSTGKGRRWRQGQGRLGPRKQRTPTRSPQEHSLTPSGGRILEGSKANHLQLLPPVLVPLFSPYPLLVPAPLPVPRAPFRQARFLRQGCAANHLPVGDLSDKDSGWVDSGSQAYQHIRGGHCQKVLRASASGLLRAKEGESITCRKGRYSLTLRVAREVPVRLVVCSFPLYPADTRVIERRGRGRGGEQEEPVTSRSAPLTHSRAHKF